jgi:hypothetical protein
MGRKKKEVISKSTPYLIFKIQISEPTRNFGSRHFFPQEIRTASSIYVAAGSCTLVPICSLPQPAAANHGGLPDGSNLLPACRRTSQEAAGSPSRRTAAHPASHSHHHKAGKPAAAAGNSSKLPATAAGNSSRACCRPPREGKGGGLQCRSGNKSAGKSDARVKGYAYFYA